MKDGWERHKEQITLTESDIQKMFNRYDASLKVSSFERLSGGLSHTNYKVFHTLSDEPLVLRISKDGLNMLKEYNIHHLFGSNKTIPKFYKIGEYKDFSFGFLEWKKGVLLKDKLSEYTSLETYQAGYSLGCELAKLRDIHFEASGFLDASLKVAEVFELTPDVFLNTINYFLFEGKVAQWLEGVSPEELMDFCDKYARLFLLDKSSPRLVHGDFNGLNILMDGTNVSAVLDWEFGIAGSIYEDIGNLLRYEDLPHFHEFESGLHAGLSECGENLPDEWRQMAKLADLVSLFSMLDNDLGGLHRVRDINRLIRGTLNSHLF